MYTEKPVNTPLTSTETPFQAGFVALVGKPNVGKSTLLNKLLGTKIAIVSPRPQTTRVPLRGILHLPNAQIIFVDTPGIHSPKHALGHFMVQMARQAIPSADIICMMVDISSPPTNLDRQIAQQVCNTTLPRLLLLNKVDCRPRDNNTHLEDYRALGLWDMEIALSAIKGEGVPMLIDELLTRLPAGAPLYPDDWFVDQSMQYLAGEIVREKVLLYTNQEVPHAVAIEVDEWLEKEHATYIRMSINVEKANQKRIVIGSGGEKLKRIGSAARHDIERMIEQRVYLDLWVKVRDNWRNDTSSLGWLGYTAKEFR